MIDWLGKLISLDDLRRTVLRFPASVLCAVVGFFLLSGLNYDFIEETEALKKGFVLLAFGYLWFGAVRLFCESVGWNVLKQSALSLAIFAPLTVFVCLSTEWEQPLLFLFPALLLFLSVAPFVRGGDDVSFWSFNRVTWVGVAIAYLAAGLFGAGASAALWSVEKLFDLDISGKSYGELWIFAFTILAPISALTWVPEKFSFVEEECDGPPGLFFILNWIAAPLVLVYLLILYAYFIKIGIAGTLPNGHLAYMISGFGGVGIATYLLAWPLRESGQPLLRFVHRYFFPALLIPIGVHFLAVWERVQAYGITEPRYMILLSAIWFGIVALVFVFRKGNVTLKFIPATLCILLVVAAFGPWGAASVSAQSQFNRLEEMLLQYDILEDEKIVETQQDVPFDDRKNISSMVGYMCESEGRRSKIKAWFPEDEVCVMTYEEETGRVYPRNMVEQMGIGYVDPWENSSLNDLDDFTFSVSDGYAVDIAGYSYLRHFNMYTTKNVPEEAFVLGNKGRVNASMDGYVLTLEMDGKLPLKFDVFDFFEEKIQGGMAKADPERLFMDVANKDWAARLDFSHVRLDDINTKLNIMNISFILLIKL